MARKFNFEDRLGFYGFIECSLNVFLKNILLNISQHADAFVVRIVANSCGCDVVGFSFVVINFGRNFGFVLIIHRLSGYNFHHGFVSGILFFQRIQFGEVFLVLFRHFETQLLQLGVDQCRDIVFSLIKIDNPVVCIQDVMFYTVKFIRNDNFAAIQNRNHRQSIFQKSFGSFNFQLIICKIL